MVNQVEEFINFHSNFNSLLPFEAVNEKVKNKKKNLYYWNESQCWFEVNSNDSNEQIIHHGIY